MSPVASDRSGPVVLVSGARQFSGVESIRRLEEVLSSLSPSLLVVGDCPRGADEVARAWACWYSPSPVRVDLHRADWSRLGRAAGPRRNAAMIDRLCSLRALGRSVVCVFCWPPVGVVSRGTRDCFRRACAACLPYVELGPRPAGLAGLSAPFLDCVA